MLQHFAPFTFLSACFVFLFCDDQHYFTSTYWIVVLAVFSFTMHCFIYGLLNHPVLPSD